MLVWVQAGQGAYSRVAGAESRWWDAGRINCLRLLHSYSCIRHQTAETPCKTGLCNVEWCCNDVANAARLVPQGLPKRCVYRRSSDTVRWRDAELVPGAHFNQVPAAAASFECCTAAELFLEAAEPLLPPASDLLLLGIAPVIVTPCWCSHPPAMKHRTATLHAE